MQIRSAQFVISATDLDGCPDPDVPEFAFIGRSNVGKSSLINRLTGQAGLAKVSATPGHTKTLNFFLINRDWHLVDLPGYGFAQKNLAARERFEEMIIDYLEQRESLIRVFVLIDSRLPMQKLDRDFVQWLIGADIDFALVFTKVDKTKPSCERRAGNLKHSSSNSASRHRPCLKPPLKPALENLKSCDSSEPKWPA
jgi:GTP-binding protein